MAEGAPQPQQPGEVPAPMTWRQAFPRETEAFLWRFCIYGMEHQGEPAPQVDPVGYPENWFFGVRPFVREAPVLSQFTIKHNGRTRNIQNFHTINDETTGRPVKVDHQYLGDPSARRIPVTTNEVEWFAHLGEKNGKGL